MCSWLSSHIVILKKWLTYQNAFQMEKQQDQMDFTFHCNLNFCRILFETHKNNKQERTQVLNLAKAKIYVYSGPIKRKAGFVA